MKVSVEEMWKSYEQKVLPLNAPAIQRLECRAAFWAGACSVFYTIVGALDPGEEPTEADLSMMADLHQEFLRFRDSIR